MAYKYNPGDYIGPNKILMLERTYKDNHNHWYGLFKCPYNLNKCKETFETRIDNIVKGDTKSCGCLNLNKVSLRMKEIGKLNKNDLVGKKFGYLQVLEDSGKRYNGSILWTCKCSCGTIIDVLSDCLQRGQISCGHIKSKGEEKITNILSDLNIDFIKQKRFNECKDENLLPFDFYLPQYNCCIEYQGEQHYKAVDYFGGEEYFQRLKNHDKIKEQFCIEKNITLIKISYVDFNSLSKEYILQRLEKECDLFMVKE